MKRELITIKVDADIHRKVKTYCASIGLSLLDYYNARAISGVPTFFKIGGKKKVK